MRQSLVLACQDIPADADWLSQQPYPVIAYGAQDNLSNADVVMENLAAAQAVEARIAAAPIAAMTLVQVLRSVEQLPLAQALDVESLAYSTLQAGPEYQAWLNARADQEPLAHYDDEPVLLSREGSIVRAVLNRPQLRNSISVEMRDGWVQALELLEADDSITELTLSGLGACFSVGGELAEFGSTPDPATAHWVRSVCSPARLMAKLGARVSCHVHGACIGSGIELPAFSSRVVAHSKSYFQLPELKFGLIPGAGGTVSFSARIGRHKTAWMVLTGRRISAQLAHEWGLVDEIIDWQ